MKHLLVAHDLRQANGYRAHKGLPGRDTHNVVTHLDNLRGIGDGHAIHLLPGWHNDRPDWEITLIRQLVAEAQRKGAVIHQ